MASPVIAGAAETEYVRGTEKPLERLYIEAALAACADAGVDPSTIDGIIVPGTRGKAEDLINGLGAKDVRLSCRSELGGAAPVAAMGLAMAAIRAGQAERIVISTARLGYSVSRVGTGGDTVLAELRRILPSPLIRSELEQPNGLLTLLHAYSLHANLWMHAYDIDRRALATVAVTTRRHAQLNSRAYMRGRPMDYADYDASPVVCDPLRVLDCCLETDGAAAIVVTAHDSVRPNPRNVRILAATEGHPDTPDDVVNRPDMKTMGITKAAPRAFEAASVGPKDIDFAEIYDCFTYIVLRQLEEMSFLRTRRISPFRGRDGHRARRGPAHQHARRPAFPGTHDGHESRGRGGAAAARGGRGPADASPDRTGDRLRDFADGSIAILSNQ